MGYEEKLRRSTAKIGGTFIEYDRQTGTCVFEVEHFSKYKLQTDDSDEEEGGEGEGREGLPKRVKMAKEGHQARQTSSKTGQSSFKTSQTRQLDEDEAMSDEEQFRDAEDGVAPMEPRPPAPPPSHSMTAAMGLNTHHIQVMKASFFGANKRGNPGGVVRGGYHWQPTQDQIGGHGNWLLSGRHRQSDTIATGMERTLGGIEFRDTPSPIPYLPSDTPSHHFRGNKAQPTRATPIPTPSQSLLDFAGEDSLHHSTVQNLSRSSFLHSTTAGRSARRPRPPAPPTYGLIKGQVTPRGDLNSLVPMSDSLVCGRTRLAADAGLFLGRSFRVGWGPNWTLSHSGSSISGTRHGNGTHSLQVVVEKVSPTPFMINAPPQRISPFFEPYLASQLEHSDVKFDSDSSIPRFHPKEGACLLHGFDALSRHLPPSRDGDGLAQRQMQLLWGLAMALWGELEGASENPALADQTSYVHRLARRKAVTRWLMQAAASTVEKEVSASGDTDSEYLGALLSLVSGRQIAGACHLAHRHGDHKLALLLGQITGGKPNFRRLAYEQLDLWRRLGVQEHISCPRLCLYALLAGLMVWDRDEEGEGGEGVNVCRGLDWKRVFGLHLWYSCSPTARVAEAVAQFTRAFSDEGCYTLPPVPAYMEMKGAGFVPPTFGNYDDLTLDSCFHLLRLYCARDHSLERSLDPATSVPFHLDYRISWHLWSVLHSLYYTHLHASSLSLLHLSFSSQLESVGLWHWAVFVLLHLPLPAAREESVRAVMMRGCSASEEMTDEEVCVCDLLIPTPSPTAYLINNFVHTLKILYC
ncbi:Nuclear pore complex protein Nup98-Nup96 [Geodia barretti]|nr:Nuclear pore complex protein Nup98-Nup96 [Geodia barretti]